MRSSTGCRRLTRRWLLTAVLCATTMALGPAALAMASAGTTRAAGTAARGGTTHAKLHRGGGHGTKPSGWLSGSAGDLGASAVPSPAAGAAPQASRPRPALHGRARAHRLDRAGTRAKLAKRRGRRPAGARTRAAAAHAANDPAVAIVDFAFHPGTVTVHAGDTITWTNSGQQPHSATADNHGFDTGVLQHGQSASHTFTQPGTYTYFCIVHPYMRGTIVVLAATTTTTSPSTSTTKPAGPTTPSSTSTATTATSATPTASSGPTLPVTGLDVPIAVLLAGALLGAGFAIRVALR